MIWDVAAAFGSELDPSPRLRVLGLREHLNYPPERKFWGWLSDACALTEGNRPYAKQSQWPYRTR